MIYSVCLHKPIIQRRDKTMGKILRARTVNKRWPPKVTNKVLGECGKWRERTYTISEGRSPVCSV